MNIINTELENIKNKPYMITCPFYYDIKDKDFIYIDNCKQYNEVIKFFNIISDKKEYSFKVSNEYRQRIKPGNKLLILTADNQYAYITLSGMSSFNSYNDNSNNTFSITGYITKCTEELKDYYNYRDRDIVRERRINYNSLSSSIRAGSEALNSLSNAINNAEHILAGHIHIPPDREARIQSMDLSTTNNSDSGSLVMLGYAGNGPETIPIPISISNFVDELNDSAMRALGIPPELID